MTNLLSQRSQWLLLAIMMLMMVATRYNHFFNQTLLSDVTWAAFFMAGLVIASRLAPVLLMVGVLVLDLGWRLFADTTTIDSTGCVSSAYPFLVAAYASLWLIGRLTARFADVSLKGLAITYVGLTAGVFTSFLISNAAWYALSGQVDAMSVSEFSTAVTPYFLSFLQGAAFWLSLSVAAWFSLSKLAAHRVEQQA